MGAKCCAESKQDDVPTAITSDAATKDLPAIDLSGISDRYAKFEAELPFSRTLVTLMLTKIDEAEKECGDQGFVTTEALSKQLTTAAWQPLKDPNSSLSKVLLSPQFKDSEKNQSSEQIDVVWLKVFSLMHCSGKIIDKTNAFYCILQEGGFEKHEQISAQDKDFNPVFEKIVKFATVDVFALAELTGSVSPKIYSEEEEQQLVSDELVEGMREDGFLETVFGTSSRISSDAWVQKVLKEANYLFDATKLR